jgi:hypothetical protein
VPAGNEPGPGHEQHLDRFVSRHELRPAALLEFVSVVAGVGCGSPGLSRDRSRLIITTVKARAAARPPWPTGAGRSEWH